MCPHPHINADFSPHEVRWVGSRPLSSRAARRRCFVVSQIYRFDCVRLEWYGWERPSFPRSRLSARRESNPHFCTQSSDAKSLLLTPRKFFLRLFGTSRLLQFGHRCMLVSLRADDCRSRNGSTRAARECVGCRPAVVRTSGIEPDCAHTGRYCAVLINRRSVSGSHHLYSVCEVALR